MSRVRSEATGTDTPSPFALRCACGEPVWIDSNALEFTFVGTWEPSLIVVEVYVAQVTCPCGVQHHVERHKTDGWGGARDELFAGEPTSTLQAAMRSE